MTECELELYGTFEVNERDKRLYYYATRYHTETEAYDRTVCTGPVREGSIMPATPHEMKLIIRNAIAVRKRISFDAELDGLTREELSMAIHKWNGNI